MNVEEKIQELEERIEALEANPEDIEDEESLESFVEKVSPENHQQCAVAIGYYYDKKEGEKFALKDIEKGFEESRWKKYSNMSMLKSKLVDEKEWLMQSGETDDSKKLYKLTKDGLNFVEERLEE